MPWLVAAEAALRGGVDVVQFREKDLSDDEFFRRASLLRSVCVAHRTLFIVNDRIDVAHEIGADGVHLGQDDASIHEARQTLGPDAVVGLSTHDETELQRALDSGADYVGVGSLFPTATKGRAVSVGSPARLAPLAVRAEEQGTPAFGIGGIDAACIDEVARAGFTRIATCAGVLAAADPAAVVRHLRAAVTPSV